MNYKKLSVIIPAYNESKTLPEIIRRVKEAPLQIEKEIIVADDRSTDETPEVLREIEGIHIVRLPENRGKGGALKAGIKAATGDIIIFQDADLEYDPKDFERVIQPIIDGRVRATNGVRIEHRLRESNFVSVGILGWIGNNTITWLTNILYLHWAGEYEGCYKAFDSELLKSVEIKTDSFDFDNELVCKLLKRGEKIADVPIHYYPRSYAEGKKINWRHGFKILETIVRCRFSRS